MLRKWKLHLLATALIACGAMLFASGQANAATAALTPGASYTVILSKMLSDGTTSPVSSTTAVADGSGKISFSLSGVPTCPSTNFLIITVKDSNGNIVRESFSPAPPAGSTNKLGANGVSTDQAKALVAAGQKIGSDDPMVMAFGLLFTRSDTLSSTDISSIATLGKLGVVDGMESFMTSHGVSSSQMTTFKNALVCNQPNKDLSNFSTLMKSAVDSTSSTTSTDDMGKAGGMIADIFVDAAAKSNIDLNIVQAAFNAAGAQVNSSAGQTAMNAMSSSVQTAMDQSVQSFMTRLSTVRVQKSYSDALTTLGSSGTMVTQFNNAVTTLSTALANIDTTYASYYQNPSTMTSSIQTDINNAYNTAFTNFQTAIATTSTDITQMQTNVSNALGGSPSVSQLQTDKVGTYTDFNGSTVNWPVPQTVAVDFVANALSHGGSMSYTRTTLAIPSNMTWLSGGRTDFTTLGIPTAFANLMAMQEDIEIAEFTRYAVFSSNGNNPTMTQQQAANLAFKNNLAAVAANIGGTTDGSTAYTAAQKNALVLTQLQPSLH